MATRIPPPRRRTTKGDPPTRNTLPDHDPHSPPLHNLAKPEPAAAVGLNFKVPAGFRRDFKIEAAVRGLNQVELLQEMYAFWKQHKG